MSLVKILEKLEKFFTGRVESPVYRAIKTLYKREDILTFYATHSYTLLQSGKYSWDQAKDQAIRDIKAAMGNAHQKNAPYWENVFFQLRGQKDHISKD